MRRDHMGMRLKGHAFARWGNGRRGEHRTRSLRSIVRSSRKVRDA